MTKNDNTIAVIAILFIVTLGIISYDHRSRMIDTIEIAHNTTIHEKIDLQQELDHVRAELQVYKNSVYVDSSNVFYMFLVVGVLACNTLILMLLLLDTTFVKYILREVYRTVVFVCLPNIIEKLEGLRSILMPNAKTKIESFE